MATIRIYGDIGESWWFDEESLTGKSISDQLAQIPVDEQIDLRINSVGGDVSEALAMYHLLRGRGDKVTAYIDGYALSAASIVALAASKVVSPPASIWMLHNPSTICYGDSHEMRKTAAVLDTHKSAIMNIYCAHTGKSEAEISEVLDAETWLTGDEAIEFGLATATNGSAAIKNSAVKQSITQNRPPQWFRISAKGKEKIRSLVSMKPLELEQIDPSRSQIENTKPMANSNPPVNPDYQTDAVRLASLESQVTVLTSQLETERAAREKSDRDREAMSHQVSITSSWGTLRSKAESLMLAKKLSRHEFDELFSGAAESVTALLASEKPDIEVELLTRSLARIETRSPSALPTQLQVHEDVSTNDADPVEAAADDRADRYFARRDKTARTRR